MSTSWRTMEKPFRSRVDSDRFIHKHNNKFPSSAEWRQAARVPAERTQRRDTFVSPASSEFVLSMHKIKLLMKIFFPVEGTRYSYASMKRRWEEHSSLYFNNMTLSGCIQYLLTANYIYRLSKEGTGAALSFSDQTEFAQTAKYQELVQGHVTYSEQLLHDLKVFISLWRRQKGISATLDLDLIIKRFPTLDVKKCEFIFSKIFKLPLSSNAGFLAKDFYPSLVLTDSSPNEESTEDTESENESSVDEAEACPAHWDSDSTCSDTKERDDEEEEEDGAEKEEPPCPAPSVPFGISPFSFFSPASVLSQNLAAIQCNKVLFNEELETDCLARLLKLFYRDSGVALDGPALFTLREQLWRVFEKNTQTFPYNRHIVESALRVENWNALQTLLIDV